MGLFVASHSRSPSRLPSSRKALRRDTLAKRGVKIFFGPRPIQIKWIPYYMEITKRTKGKGGSVLQNHVQLNHLRGEFFTTADARGGQSNSRVEEWMFENKGSASNLFHLFHFL